MQLQALGLLGGGLGWRCFARWQALPRALQPVRVFSVGKQRLELLVAVVVQDCMQLCLDVKGLHHALVPAPFVLPPHANPGAAVNVVVVVASDWGALCGSRRRRGSCALQVQP